MNENHTIHLTEIPIGGKGGFIWNRLHDERDNLCAALLKDGSADQKALLQARLRKVDDALDRLMSGSGSLHKPLSLGVPQEALMWVGEKHDRLDQ